MKKRCLVSVLFVFLGFLAFGDAEEGEEIDFLLFLPNSSSLFVNEERAMVQLDNLANYLKGRELIPGQIYVYGYAAFAANDIEPVNFSRDRAIWVISELQKRGVSKDFFSTPVGHGSVDLWGSNDDEEGRSLNRRVRVVLDNKVLTPEILRAAEPEIPISSADKVEEPIRQESATDKPKLKFPWWILLLPLILLLVLLLLKKRKKADDKTSATKADEPAAAPAAVPVPAVASEPVTPVAASTFTVNLQEEIRFRAYELYLQRNGQSENAYEDWCRAVIEISAKYKADGYEVYREDDWWARKVTYSF